MIELGNSKVKIAVSPEAGASLAYFKVVNGDKTVDVMRPATDKAINDKEANGFAMYPILPYVSRIHDGFFVYWGIKRAVPANVSFDKEPFDGDGWRNAWTVKSSDATGVTLVYAHDGKKGFPFAYEAEVTYKVFDSGFSVRIVLKNTGMLPSLNCFTRRSLSSFGVEPVILKYSIFSAFRLSSSKASMEVNCENRRIRCSPSIALFINSTQA